MHNLFSPDSKFMQGMSRGADLILLNLYFLVTCLPVVTIGPSLAALYSVVFVMGTAREKGASLGYFRAFRENFGPALRLWLLLMAIGAALTADLILFTRLGGIFVWLNVAIGILLAILLLGSAVIFPMVSLFSNTTMAMFKNGLILGLANLPRAVLVVALWAFPVYLLVRQPVVFFYSAFLWVVVYFAAAAYFSALLLRKVLRLYLPEDMFEEEKA